MKLNLRHIIFFFSLFTLSVYGQEVNESDNFMLRGKVIDNETKAKISSAEVRIIGSDTSDISLHVDSNGVFVKNLKYQTAYTIVVSAPNYLNAKGREFGPHGSESSNHLYELEKIESCSGLIPLITYAKNDFKNPVIPDEEDSNALELLSTLLKDNPTLIVELIGYRDSNEIEEVSSNRANYAVNAIKKSGISEKRIKPKDGRLDKTITETKRSSDLNQTNISHNRMLIFNIIGTTEK